MRTLILGGTGFLGRHYVHAAVARGHDVTVLSRGATGVELPDGVRRVIADRRAIAGLDPIDGLDGPGDGDWDVVIDVATYVPSWVRSLGERLSGRVGHYTFVSTVLTYADPTDADETSAVTDDTGPGDPHLLEDLTDTAHYGALKVLCEREAERWFPGRTLVIRPGTIVGPGERLGTLTYWAARLARGGEVLVTGDPLAPVQYIDARDLAEWSLRLAQGRETGVLNAIGPGYALGWAEMLGGIRAAFSPPTRLTWVPERWIERRVATYSSQLFWPRETGIPGAARVSVDRALAAGLTSRPLADTVRDTVAWFDALPAAARDRAIPPFDAGASTLSDALRREADLLGEWHARPVRHPDEDTEIP